MTDPEHSKNPAEANMTQYQPEAENFDGGLPPEPVLSKTDKANLAANEQVAQDQPEAEEQETGGKRRKTTKR